MDIQNSISKIYRNLQIQNNTTNTCTNLQSEQYYKYLLSRGWLDNHQIKSVLLLFSLIGYWCNVYFIFCCWCWSKCRCYTCLVRAFACLYVCYAYIVLQRSKMLSHFSSFPLCTHSVLVIKLLKQKLLLNYVNKLGLPAFRYTLCKNILICQN